MARVLFVVALLIAVALALRHPAPAPIVLTSAGSRSIPSRVDARRHAAGSVLVYVAGDVPRPGLYRMDPSARAADAVSRAGGMLPGADGAGVNLAAPLEDGQQITVPKIGQKPSRSRSVVRVRHLREKRSVRAPLAPIDLNAADAKTLEQLPGIGAELAERLIAYRRLNGPFRSVDELADVAGMTQRRIDVVAPYLALHEGSQR